jgi:hypothetical protein
MRYFQIAYAVALAACGADTNSVSVDLAPDVISSIDGTLTVRATAFADREPVADERIGITVDYTDRNGTAHPIAGVDDVTDESGAASFTLTGFTFDGIGEITASVLSGGPGSEPLQVDGQPLAATATFAVLDRTPPVVTIVPPANNQISVNQDLRISVHVTDEIGISEVFFETSSSNGTNRDRSTVVASGSMDATVSFDVNAQDNQIGSQITLFALAADLSGNQAAAAPVTLDVVQ